MATPISPICRQNILVLARAYVKRRKPQLKLSSISSLAHGDPLAFDKLAAGKKASITVRKYDEVMAWFEANWPENMTKPVTHDPFPPTEKVPA